jgi:hypothetical protein
MNDDVPIGPTPRRRQFSLRTLLLVVLLICTFLAGRLSMRAQVERAQAEGKRARTESELVRRRLEAEVTRLRLAAVRATLSAYQGRHPVGDIEKEMMIEKGMMIDALEHEKRFERLGIEVLPREH